LFIRIGFLANIRVGRGCSVNLILIVFTVKAGNIGVVVENFVIL